MKSPARVCSYKNIIFDLGGVLLEWNPADFLQKLQVPSHFVDIFNSLLWATHDGGWLTRQEVIAKLPSEYNKEAFAYCIERIAPHLYPIKEMLEIFYQVRREGYKVYILSNMPQEIHQELVQLHDFFRFPDGQVYSYEVRAIKPQPQIYEALLKKYRLIGTESVFIDDREDNIFAAKKLGIQGIVYNSPAQVREELRQLKVID